jgi:hypothetical protein
LLLFTVVTAPGVATVKIEEVELECPALDTELLTVCLSTKLATATDTKNSRNFMLARCPIRQDKGQNTKIKGNTPGRSRQTTYYTSQQYSVEAVSPSFQHLSGTLLHLQHVGIGLVLIFLSVGVLRRPI